MLILKRRPGEWIEVTHEASKDKFMLQIHGIEGNVVSVHLDDKPRLFGFVRPGWTRKPKEGEAK